MDKIELIKLKKGDIIFYVSESQCVESITVFERQGDSGRQISIGRFVYDLEGKALPQRHLDRLFSDELAATYFAASEIEEKRNCLHDRIAGLLREKKLAEKIRQQIASCE